jgi:ankyrin repeat protein
LIIASAHGHLEVATMLLKAGAEIDMEHPELVTPLMYAAAGGFPDVVKLLIDKGAGFITSAMFLSCYFYPSFIYLL